MNFKEIKNAVKHLKETCTCPSCKIKYREVDINIVASTSSEALFELNCEACETSTIVTVLQSHDNDEGNTPSPMMKRPHKKVSQDDVLDVKNFLSRFDGNFKKLFTKKK